MITFLQYSLGSELTQHSELKMWTPQNNYDASYTRLASDEEVYVEEGSIAVLECGLRNITSDLMVSLK